MCLSVSLSAPHLLAWGMSLHGASLLLVQPGMVPWVCVQRYQDRDLLWSCGVELRGFVMGPSQPCWRPSPHLSSPWEETGRVTCSGSLREEMGLGSQSRV